MLDEARWHHRMIPRGALMTDDRTRRHDTLLAAAAVYFSMPGSPRRSCSAHRRPT